MKLNILISAAALLLVCAAPGALASNMRGSDAAALALGTTNHGEGTAVESNPFDNYASRGQGGDDSNGNPCYCNDPKIRKSKKLCLDGYTCENHKCEGSGPRPDRASCKDEKILKVAEGGSCNKQKECVASCNCAKGICRSKMRENNSPGNAPTPVRLPVPEGSACGASSGDVCFPGFDCLDDICTRPLVAEGSKCDRKKKCVASCSCDDGICRSKTRTPIRLPVPLYGACGGSMELLCVEGLSCVDGFCRAMRPINDGPAGEGGACDIRDGRVCSGFLNCVDGICRDMDTRNAPAGGGGSGGWVGLDQDCSTDHSVCLSSLTCRKSSLNGSDRWYCRRLQVQALVSSVGSME